MLTQEKISLFFSDLEALGLRFPVSELAKKTGYSKGNVSDFINRKKSISESFIDKFYEVFYSSKNVSHDIPSLVEESQESYLAKRREIKNGSKHPIPVYGGYTTLGNIEIIDDENIKHRVVAELPADVFPGCDHAEKAKGDSMYPLIMNQALLVGRTCTVKGISFGEKYIIKTKDGLDTTKFVHPGKGPETIILKAYNKSIPEQEIDIKDIVFCCRVFWIVNPT